MNTAQKRMSAMNLASPWRGPLVDATESGTTQGNRQAAAFMYAGILAASVAVSAADYSLTLNIDRAHALELNIDRAHSATLNIDRAMSLTLEK